MESKILKSIILVYFVFTYCIVDCQYFSTSGGVFLPRSGRSYLTSLLNSADRQSQQPIPDLASSQIKDGPSLYQEDKLSFRKYLNKLYGKRSNFDDDFGPSSISKQDYMTKKEMINYLINKLMSSNKDGQSSI